VKQEAGANKVKLQVRCREAVLIRPLQITLQVTIHALTYRLLLQALVAEWEQAQAEGGAKSLSAGDSFTFETQFCDKFHVCLTFPPSADAELKLKVEAMHAGQVRKSTEFQFCFLTRCRLRLRC
jgi:hypothetical protein